MTFKITVQQFDTEKVSPDFVDVIAECGEFRLPIRLKLDEVENGISDIKRHYEAHKEFFAKQSKMLGAEIASTEDLKAHLESLLNDKG